MKHIIDGTLWQRCKARFKPELRERLARAAELRMWTPTEQLGTLFHCELARRYYIRSDGTSFRRAAREAVDRCGAQTAAARLDLLTLRILEANLAYREGDYSAAGGQYAGLLEELQRARGPGLRSDAVARDREQLTHLNWLYAICSRNAAAASIKAGRFAEAEALIRDGQRCVEGWPELYRALSELRMGQGRWIEAKAALDEASLIDGAGDAEFALASELADLHLKHARTIKDDDPDGAVRILRDSTEILEAKLQSAERRGLERTLERSTQTGGTEETRSPLGQPIRGWLAWTQLEIAQMLRQRADRIAALDLARKSLDNYQRAALVERDAKARESYYESADQVRRIILALVAEQDGPASAIAELDVLQLESGEHTLDPNRVNSFASIAAASRAVLRLELDAAGEGRAALDATRAAYAPAEYWNPYVGVIDDTRELLGREGARVAFKMELERRRSLAGVDVAERRWLVEALRDVYALRRWPLTGLEPQTPRSGVPPYVNLTAPIILEFGETVLSQSFVEDVLIPTEVPAMRDRLRARFGVKLPGIRFRHGLEAPDGWYEIRIMDISREEGCVPERSPADPGASGAWLLERVEHVLVRTMPLFVGHQEVQNRLEEEGLYEDVVTTEAVEFMSALTRMVRALLAERVPIRDMALLVETFRALGAKSANIPAACRTFRLLPAIRPQLWGNERGRSGVALPPAIERELVGAIRSVDGYVVLVLGEGERERIRDAVGASIGTNASATLVVNDERVRPLVRALISDEYDDVPVLSSRELLAESISGKIDIPADAMRRRSTQVVEMIR